MLALVYGQVDELNGWTRPELLVVLGVFTILGGLIQAVIKPNMVQFMEDVADGKLDYVLAKPVDAQLLVSIRAVRFWQGVDIVVGPSSSASARRASSRGRARSRCSAFLAGAGLAAVILYCFLLAAGHDARSGSSASTASSRSFDGIYQAGRWPVGIYPAGCASG